jgi:glyoxylase-like metal-dependent hydrolase (beta-lactamase superfamily II)
MIIRTFVAGPVEANNYLVADEATKEAVLIDCSEFNQEILDAVEDLGVRVEYILLTHGHFDHVLGANEMSAMLDAPVLIHKADLGWLENVNTTLGMFNMPDAEIPQVNGFVEDGQVISTVSPELSIKVIHTPGHTEGSVCYQIGDKIFTGDTLFLETVGRTDLPGGDFRKLKNSVENILFALDENTVVYPGHGKSTVIGHEKDYNEII